MENLFRSCGVFLCLKGLFCLGYIPDVQVFSVYVALESRKCFFIKGVL